MGNIFHTDEKEREATKQRALALQQKLGNADGTIGKYSYNPFLKRNGELMNPHINYRKLLDSPNVSDTVKGYIQKATGLSPTPIETSISDDSRKDVLSRYKEIRELIGTQPKTDTETDIEIDTETQSETAPQTQPETQSEIQTKAPQKTETQTKTPPNTSSIEKSVGKRIADTAKYNNNAAKGQCVWYVRGRAVEKLGVDTGAIGNANEMYYGAKASARLSPTADNIKANTILSYKFGTSTAGMKYGHVIFIEDVVGDTVYYTEGGSGYYQNGTDGVVKTATKEQILKGVNSSGATIGSSPVGLIDLSKYK